MSAKIIVNMKAGKKAICYVQQSFYLNNTKNYTDTYNVRITTNYRIFRII